MMMNAPTRENVLALFERHRAAPGSPYDESHFLDFLLTDPGGVHAVRNSFGGLRRLNRYIEDIQLEFGVCLSSDDRETAYSVDGLVERLTVLQRSRKGSLKSLENQARAGPGWSAVFWLNAIFIAGLFAARSIPTLAVALGLVLLGLNAFFAVFAIRTAAYLRRLRARIEGA